MLLMMVDVDMDLLLLVRVKKKKGKKSRALPTEREKRRESKSNHLDDVPAWEKSNIIIIITIVRIDDGILYYYHLISPLPVCEFCIKFPQFERQKNTWSNQHIFEPNSNLISNPKLQCWWRSAGPPSSSEKTAKPTKVFFFLPSPGVGLLDGLYYE